MQATMRLRCLQGSLGSTMPGRAGRAPRVAPSAAAAAARAASSAFSNPATSSSWSGLAGENTPATTTLRAPAAHSARAAARTSASSTAAISAPSYSYPPAWACMLSFIPSASLSTYCMQTSKMHWRVLPRARKPLGL
jgi:hypothetical protein